MGIDSRAYRVAIVASVFAVNTSTVPRTTTVIVGVIWMGLLWVRTSREKRRQAILRYNKALRSGAGAASGGPATATST